MNSFPVVPPWQVGAWFNAPRALALEDMRGKVVVLEAFQMLCPGCVSHGLPQASRIHELLSADEVSVVGLHTVFEHHAAMTPVALQAFLHEYRIRFPVGVDVPGNDGPIPATMRSYGMRGTPTLVLIDTQGRIRHHHFGRVDDLLLGAQIASLIKQVSSNAMQGSLSRAASDGCRDDGCEVLPP